MLHPIKFQSYGSNVGARINRAVGKRRSWSLSRKLRKLKRLLQISATGRTRLSTIADASMMLRQKIASNLILIPQGPRTVQLWAYGCYFRAMTACQIT
ncbi:hypothetical protein FQN55_001384, partial [Onygenales sp. PD_40]